MSYLVGKKIFLEGNVPFIDEAGYEKHKELSVKYIDSTDMFTFRLSRVVCKCSREDAYKLIRFNDVYHKCPPGYEYNKIEKSAKELHDQFVYEESSGGCGSEEFFIISVLCYLYCLNETVLDKAFMRRGGGYVNCHRRSEEKRGRKVGFKVEKIRDGIYDAEALERKTWNQEVALRKGLCNLYIEAEREYCREVGCAFRLNEVEMEWRRKIEK